MSKLAPEELQHAAYPIVGPVAMGYCAALVLYGILVMAWVNYTKTPAWDRAAKAQRAIIYVVMLLTTLITTFYIRDLYFYTTITPVDLTPLLIGTEVGQLEPLFVGLIAFIVQTTLAWRSSKVIKRPAPRWLYLVGVGSLIILSLLGSAGAIMYTIHYHNSVDPDGPLALDFPTMLLAWMWSAAATDFAISISYILMLRQRMRGGYEIEKKMYKMIGTIALQSASYTTILAVISAIFSQAFTLNGAFNSNCIPYAAWLPLPQLYALSLFTTLSTAQRVVDTLGSGEELTGVRLDSSSKSQETPGATTAGAQTHLGALSKHGDLEIGMDVEK